MDIRELNRQAVLASVEAVGRVDDDLGRATPCEGWVLADLLAHMTAQHRGFAAAARGHGGDLHAWEVRPLGADPAGEYAVAAQDVLDAFTRSGVLERKFVLPELGATIPGATAIGFHFIDYVVHTWDVARSLGDRFDLAPELAGPALEIARAVPDDSSRSKPGAAFGPSVSPARQDAALDEILALLGRSPAWPDRDR
ncbi:MULTISPECIES: TIGR03086 family metal-binding protein [unclassified Streptomyces]|uniref:TIGR03086 family metal-binding protein n=1 Tax=unclassified Streptomyces TaxID=2593676 RepID=UPI00278C2BCB|nr:MULTISPECIES: TIGR03086 family metal-binding protein [unclassified Streptomyces]